MASRPLRYYSHFLFAHPAHISSAPEWVPLELKQLGGSIKKAAGLSEMWKITFSIAKLLASERRGRVNAGRLDSHHPVFFKTILCHALSTLQKSRKKNKSRLFNPGCSCRGFMHFAKEPSNQGDHHFPPFKCHQSWNDHGKEADPWFRQTLFSKGLILK